jgi:hypothetical protein
VRNVIEKEMAWYTYGFRRDSRRGTTITTREHESSFHSR